MTDRYQGMAKGVRLLCGRLLVASMVAGFKRPSHALAWGMQRAGWVAELRGANASAAAALMGILDALGEGHEATKAETSKKIAFINTYPWFGGEPTDGVEN